MRRITSIFLSAAFALFIAGCTQSPEDMATRKITKKVVESSSPEQLIQNMCDAFMAESVDDVIALTHPDTRTGVRGGRIMNSAMDDLKGRFEAYDIEECTPGAIQTSQVGELKEDFQKKHNIDVSLLGEADYTLKTGSNPDSFVEESVSIVKVDGNWYLFP